MILRSARSREEMVPVLMDPSASGPDVAYWMFTIAQEGKKSKWQNMTILNSDLYGSEFTKTFGHYHSVETPETYKLISGIGILMLQKRVFGDDDYIDDQISEIYFVELKPGEEITITPEWGHSWSNIGNEPLILFDDWKEGHTDDEYEHITKVGGMAYFLTTDHGSPNFVKNKMYKEIPNPKWTTLEDFNAIS